MTILKSNETILFIGDSITDCGRCDPQHQPLGCGYVQMFADMLAVREPKKKINIINTGIGGNTIEDLRSRWVDDALLYKPDWLSIKIGINDCNRWICDKSELQCSVKFAKIFEELLTITVKELPNIKILLIDPFYASQDVEEKVPGAYREKVSAELPKYIDTVHKMSEKYNTKHVKTHELFHEHFKAIHPTRFFPNEPVHPNSGGHLFIAEAVYKELS
jgi:acyl-CoA thioesterase I